VDPQNRPDFSHVALTLVSVWLNVDLLCGTLPASKTDFRVGE
jgi:hypothetical protein